MTTGCFSPALLSRVAHAFQSRIVLRTHSKAGIEYPSCFLGSEAVDTLCAVINSPDRNLALLVGRALFAQRFIYDATFHGSLKDSSDELYKLEAEVLVGGSLGELNRSRVTLDRSTDVTEDDDMGSQAPQMSAARKQLPTGVFTLLTNCYAPSCDDSSFCYSPSCPRRLSQLQKRSVNAEDLDAFDFTHKLQDDDWWTTTVPKDVLDSVSKQEEKRQNAIYDIIKTERNFVEELKIIQAVYAKPLRHSGAIEEFRAEDFYRTVFLNSADILNVNSKLLQKLLHRQREEYIVEKVGDIFVSIANEFFVYVEYCGNREYSRNEIAIEKLQNSKFREFLTEVTFKKMSTGGNKQELDAYLHKPIARMASYQLLLKAIHDKTPDAHPDKTLIPQAIKSISEVLAKMNEASGLTINTIKLRQLTQQIQQETHDLQLQHPERKYHYEGQLVLKRSSGDVHVTVFLFDHCLLMTKDIKRTENDGTSTGKSKNYQYAIYKKPIPLELIVVAGKDSINKRNYSKSKNSDIQTMSRRKAGATVTPVANTFEKGGGVVGALHDSRLTFSITHVGRNGGMHTFACETESGRNAWQENIQKQCTLRQKRAKFEVLNLVEVMLPQGFKVNCTVLLGDRLVVGTDNGIYVGPEGNFHSTSAGDSVNEETWDKFERVLDLEHIYQIAILKDHDVVIVLSDKTLLAFQMDLLNTDQAESDRNNRKGKKLADSINFFKTGVCADRLVVAAVRSLPLSSTIKVFEPVGLGIKRRGKLGRLFVGYSDSLHLLNEFYIPAEATSIHFLKTKFCVGCTKGFEIVDFETLDTLGLLDPSDSSLNFAMNRETLRPLSIFKVAENNYLLCYNEMGFYVDKFGRRARSDLLITWAGSPIAFAFMSPYVIAFESSFIEVWNSTTGQLQQVLNMHELRPLNTTGDAVLAVTCEGDAQVLFALSRMSDHDS